MRSLFVTQAHEPMPIVPPSDPVMPRSAQLHDALPEIRHSLVWNRHVSGTRVIRFYIRLKRVTQRSSTPTGGSGAFVMPTMP